MTTVLTVPPFAELGDKCATVSLRLLGQDVGVGVRVRGEKAGDDQPRYESSMRWTPSSAGTGNRCTGQRLGRDEGRGTASRVAVIHSPTPHALPQLLLACALSRDAPKLVILQWMVPPSPAAGRRWLRTWCMLLPRLQRGGARAMLQPRRHDLHGPGVVRGTPRHSHPGACADLYTGCH